MSNRGQQLYLQDILSSIGKIKSYTTGLSFEEFSHNSEKIDAVVRNLEIIGEAARNVSQETMARYPEVPWQQMVSMRNKVLHEYFGVDEEILWETISKDLPALEDQLKKLLSQDLPN